MWGKMLSKNGGFHVCREKERPVVMYFRVNWKGQLVLPASEGAACEHVGYDVLQNGNPLGERGGVNGARDEEGRDFWRKWDTESWEGQDFHRKLGQRLCHWWPLVMVVLLRLDKLVMKICFINGSWNRIKMSLVP